MKILRFPARQEAVEIFKESDLILTGKVSLYELGKKSSVSFEQIKDSVEEFSLVDAEKASELYRELEERGVKINQINYLIAAQALNRDLPLLTLDRDFQEINGLETDFYRETEC